MRLAARHRLVVEDLPVQAGLEDALDAGLQLQADEDGRPALEDLSRPTGGLVEVVSRDAVFDDDAMLRIDHLSKGNRARARGLPAPLSGSRSRP
jgi:hypothetical protein